METAAVKWCYRPGWVLVLLFVVLGPLGLPYLWKSPSFSRPMKVLLTLLEIAYTLLLLRSVVATVRLLQEQLAPLDDY